MKVKIRGLVFVGFAAAVFAQSAMADANDAKTVTSKLYVDTKFQDQSNRVESTTGLTSTDWQSTVKYPSMAVLNEVKSQVSGIDVVSGNETYVSVTEGTGDNAGTFTVNTAQAPATTNGGITGTLTQTTTTGGVTTPGTEDALVTAKAVKSLIDTGLSDAENAENDTTMPTSLAVVSYAEKKANKATAIIPTGETGANVAVADGGNDKYPTTKAVYDFVTTQGGNFQPKAPTTDGTSLYLGHNTVDGTTNTADWKKLEAVATDAQSSTDYVTIKEDSGVYKINIPTAQVGTVIGDIASNGTKLATGKAVYSLLQTAGSGTDATTINNTNATGTDGDKKVPTVKNVYNFVTTYGGNTYQPKVSTAGSVQVGYLGTGEGATAGWKTVQNSAYVRLIDTETSGVMSLELDTDKIADAGSTIAGSTGATTGGGDDLASAWAVKDYVSSLLNGNVLPAPGSDCQLGANGITDSNDKACALVLAYWTAADSPTGTAGVGLKWVPMAQTVSSGSSGGGE